MKHNKWLFRLTAMVLSTTLLLTSISFPANAAETSTSTVDSVEIETAIPTEEDSTEEDSTETTASAVTIKVGIKTGFGLDIGENTGSGSNI